MRGGMIRVSEEALHDAVIRRARLLFIFSSVIFLARGRLVAIMFFFSRLADGSDTETRNNFTFQNRRILLFDKQIRKVLCSCPVGDGALAPHPLLMIRSSPD